MLNIFQAVIFGMLQGITELFPISSLGHSVILPKLLGWSINQKDPNFLVFLVATHTATAVVLFGFFWKDWKKIIGGLFRTLMMREIKESDPYGKLAWLLVIATIPAGILGLLFEESLKDLFARPNFVAFVLVLNGLMLFGADFLSKKRSKKESGESDIRIAKLTWVQSIKVGVMQCLALLPGFSRTGSTITGSLFVGLSHEDSARYSFLLATPIIGAASLLKLPELATEAGKEVLFPTLIGALASGIAAYVSVKFLTKYFESQRLKPFAIYCLILGMATSILFLVR